MRFGQSWNGRTADCKKFRAKILHGDCNDREGVRPLFLQENSPENLAQTLAAFRAEKIGNRWQEIRSKNLALRGWFLN